MPDLPQGDPSEMTAGWKDCFAPSASLGAETVEAFAGKVASKKVHTVEVRHQPSEAVPHHLIEAWISKCGSS